MPLLPLWLLVGIGLVLGQEDEVGRDRSQQHLTVGREAGGRGQAWRGAAPNPAHPRPTKPSILLSPRASAPGHLMRIQSAAFWLAMSVSR